MGPSLNATDQRAIQEAPQTTGTGFNGAVAERDGSVAQIIAKIAADHDQLQWGRR